MSELLPIIRRVRRPLLPVEGLAGGHQANAKPAVVPAAGSDISAATTKPSNPPEPKQNGQVAPSQPTEYAR